jgi:phage terminase large subunit-like protein
MTTDSGNPKNPGHRWQTGEIVNPDGRPRGPRRNLVEEFISDLLESWKLSGNQVIEHIRTRYPDVYLHAVASLVQKGDRFRAKHRIDDDAAFAARLIAAKAELASSLVSAGPNPTAVPAQHLSETNRLATYRPYAKQRSFHAAGALHDERLFMAGNQLGKTLAGGMEWAMHLTGRYPDWWKGRVFDSPVRLWAAGVTAESTRDNPQRILLGPPQQKSRWGSGTIPKDAIKDWSQTQNIADALDYVVVRWGGGGDVGLGESVLSFKAYEKGREKWQGETLDGVWFDEEPPLDIYSEGRTRCVAKRGITILTMTPLLGMSDVVKLFLSESDLSTLPNRSA